jgi:hypothetical protein
MERCLDFFLLATHLPYKASRCVEREAKIFFGEATDLTKEIFDEWSDQVIVHLIGNIWLFTYTFLSLSIPWKF